MSENIMNNLQVTLGKAKAVAEAYSILYVDEVDAEKRANEVLCTPDRQCYLYAVLEDLIFEACELTKKM